MILGSANRYCGVRTQFRSLLQYDRTSSNKTGKSIHLWLQSTHVKETDLQFALPGVDFFYNIGGLPCVFSSD
jgi:hypothetical protein